MRTRAARATSNTHAVAAPQHNPKAPEEHLPSTLTLAPLTLAPSPNRYPWPRHRLTSAVLGIYLRLTRGASRRANRGRPPASRAAAKREGAPYPNR